MRFFPQDDNQGGFFVAVFEKLSADDTGVVEDPTLYENPWINESVRQKPMLDELEEFARWFEHEYKAQCDRDGIPED